LVLSLALLAFGGCRGDDDGDDTTDTGGDTASNWAVGVDSEMIRFGEGEVHGNYDLDLPGTPDLLAIACRGTSEAWAVGEFGTVVWTHDGGSTWENGVSGIQGELHSVAAGASPHVWTVSAESVLRSFDDGRSWSPVMEVEAADFRSIGVDATGGRAWAAGASGQIWYLDDEVAEMLLDTGSALRDISVSGNGAHVFAVGDAAGAWVSHDSGDSFVEFETGVVEDLHAASISADGETLVAAGDKGLLLISQSGVTDVQRPIGDGPTFRDVHVDHHAGIQVVGDDGHILVSDDLGITWVHSRSESGLSLRGVDAIGSLGHH
jgi:photosystem II stability/assembly factor-like uncharacterized protein